MPRAPRFRADFQSTAHGESSASWKREKPTDCRRRSCRTFGDTPTVAASSVLAPGFLRGSPCGRSPVCRAASGTSTRPAGPAFWSGGWRPGRGSGSRPGIFSARSGWARRPAGPRGLSANLLSRRNCQSRASGLRPRTPRSCPVRVPDQPDGRPTHCPATSSAHSPACGSISGSGHHRASHVPASTERGPRTRAQPLLRPAAAQGPQRLGGVSTAMSRPSRQPADQVPENTRPSGRWTVPEPWGRSSRHSPS